MVEAPVLILLAGGKSDRMGSPKGLLDFNDELWILEQISRFKNFKNPKVYVGLGYNHELYFNTIKWFRNAVNDFYRFDGVDVRVLVNPKPEDGSFSTLRTVLKEVENVNSILVLPIDVPLLNVEELQKLIAIENSIVIPKFNGKGGHPVKLSPQFWKKLLSIDMGTEESRLDYQIKKTDNLLITFLNVLDDSISLNLNNEELWLLYKKNFTEPNSYGE